VVATEKVFVIVNFGISVDDDIGRGGTPEAAGGGFGDASAFAWRAASDGRAAVHPRGPGTGWLRPRILSCQGN